MLSTLFTPRERDDKGRKVSREVQTIEAVKAKLDAARAELATAEAELNADALRVALSEDPYLAAPKLEVVEFKRKNVALLEHAVAQAEQAEQDRLRAARAAAKQSAIRAARQHLGSLKRELMVAETAYGNLVRSYARCLEIAETARRVLPEDAEWIDFARHLAPHRISDQFKTELNRQSGLTFGNPALQNHYEAKIAPNALWPTYFAPQDMPGLAERYSQHLIGFFNALVGTPQKPAAAPQEAKLPAAVEPVAPTQEAPPVGPPANVYPDIVAEREQAIADLAGPTGDVIRNELPLDFTGATEPARLTLTDVTNG